MTLDNDTRTLSMTKEEALVLIAKISSSLISLSGNSKISCFTDGLILVDKGTSYPSKLTMLIK